MKTFKIEIPKGYEIDKEKSTFENIVFKEVKNQLPKTWEELEVISGWWTDLDCDINGAKAITSKHNRNIFATKEQAEASIALSQLSQLREVYRDGWLPDWNNSYQEKACINFFQNKIETNVFTSWNCFLSFQSAEIRDLFLENFRELIEKAKPLLS